MFVRLSAEIVQDPYLDDELVFRGGTRLHKLYDTGLARYSEDLDYVRRSGPPRAGHQIAERDPGERLPRVAGR